MSAVSLHELSVSYAGADAVTAFDLTVSSGEWVSLIGPNGAGKTSVLRAIAGLAHHGGEVCIGERRTDQLSARELARQVAMLPQEPLIPVGMPVAHYVLLGRSPHLGYLGRERAADRRIVARILDRLSLTALAARPVEQLSGGERQRAAIARARAQQAPVLLIDEPTTSLDIGRQQEVLELVDQIRRDEELTVIAAMHELTLAGQYSDRLALLVGGRLVATGAPGEILTEGTIAQHYAAQVQVFEMNGSGRAVVPVRR